MNITGIVKRARNKLTERVNTAWVLKSPLFHSSWYAANNPDVRAGDACRHYVRHGGLEGRAASPQFDSAWYLREYPDVQYAGINPLVHYLRWGKTEGRTLAPSDTDTSVEVPVVNFGAAPVDVPPALFEDIDLLIASDLFDPLWYAANNPDVRAGDACRHYVRHGGLEGRAASPQFDSAWYLREYPDVQYAGINPLVHYLRWGKTEGRTLAPSDTDTSVEVPVVNFGAAPVDVPPALFEDIDLLIASDLFDPLWYVNNYPAVRGQNPFVHFLLSGGGDGLMASPDFDCGAYLRSYPDVAAGQFNPLIHYLRYGLIEGRTPGSSAGQQWAIKQTIEDVRALDPEFEASHEFFGDSLPRLPYNSSMPSTRAAIAWNRIFADLPRQVEYLVFAPWLVRGGADLACVNIVRAAQEASSLSRVLLVISDYDRLDAIAWLPVGTQVLVFSDYDPELSSLERKMIVEWLIFALRPESIMNVNSRACWDATAEKGRALNTMTRLYSTLFCRDFTADGRGAGYSDTHFRVSINNLDKVYFDTSSFIVEMAERYGLDESLRDKLEFLPQPILNELNAPSTAVHGKTDRPRRVLWAGRFCRQKNIELLERIIRRQPRISFDIWGTGDFEIDVMLQRLAQEMPSVTLCGSFTSFADLPLSTYGAYLFTSRFEGMPTVLINAAAAGLPIVASSVGGVPELVTTKTGWPVDIVEDEEAYCRALSEIYDMPEEVEQRLAAMNEKICTERSWNSFTAALTSDSGFLQRERHA